MKSEQNWNQPEQSASRKVQLPLKEWFWQMIDKMHSARPSMHKLGTDQYEEILQHIADKGGVALSDREVVQMWLVYGRWSAAKLTGIGLEVSDFTVGAETTLAHADVREMQRRCYKRAMEVVEEKMRYYEKTTLEQRQSDSLVVEYQQALGMMNNDMIELERMKDYYKRSYEQVKRENMRLRSTLAEYLGDINNTDAVDSILQQRHYENFQEAA